jgi:thioredoxin-related protein
MKSATFFLLSFFLSNTFVYSDEIKWLSSLDKGLAEAKSAGKVAMIDIFTDWCYWCKELDSKTYKDKRVIALSKSFVNIKVNPEKDAKVASFIKNYNINGYPAILFVEHTGALVLKVAGFLAADPFLKKMEEVPKIQSKIKLYKDELSAGNNTHGVALLNMLIETQRFGEAIPVFDKIRSDKKIPKEQYSEAYINIGLSFAMKNEYENAQKYFIDAEKLYADTLSGFAATYYHAYTEYLLGKKESAVAIISKVMGNPKLPPDWKAEYESVLQSFKAGNK